MHPLRAPATLPRRSVVRLAIVWLTAAVLVVGCGSTNPSATPVPSPSPTSTAAASTASSSTGSPGSSASGGDANDAVFAAIERQVITIRGLTPTRTVARQVIDEAQLNSLLARQLDEQAPPAYVAGVERQYKAFGLIPPDANLRSMQLELLTAGVAGFYRDDEQTMYVVSRTAGLGVADRITYAHEYTHALQDQRWPSLFADQRGVLDQSDRLLARQAIYEGDASLVMFDWAFANLTQAEFAEAIKTDPAQQAVYDKMPGILREELLYPYTTGLFFVQAAQTGGWPAVDAFYDRMPTSTEQILHADAYARNESPVAVAMPADLATKLGTGWSTPLLDTFGELQTGIWLRESGVARAAADAAAAGWGGDRMAVLAGPDGAWAVAWHTVWDTTADADAFETAATTALRQATGVARVLPGSGGTTRWVVVGSNAATMGKVANVLGLAG